MPDLSIVLISKNQAWNISRLLDSVLRATSSVGSKEIILVDSASTDETVQLARCYPVTILRLRPGQQLSPAIGRYVGSQRAQGDLVLFLDGDTELLAGWLPQALRVMQESPQAGVVTGKVINLPTSAARTNSAPVEQVVPLDHIAATREVLWGSYDGGGAAMYRRSVLRQVGTFHPGLAGDEEPELCLRVRHANYRVLELDYPIVRHYNDAPAAISNVLGRRRRNFLLGAGQSLRCHLGDDLFWPYVKERGRWSLAATLFLLIGLAALVRYAIAGDALWLASWLLSVLLIVAATAIHKRSLHAALIGVIHRVFQVEGLLRGFFTKPLHPASYSWSFDELRDNPDSARTNRAVGPPSPRTAETCSAGRSPRSPAAFS